MAVPSSRPVLVVLFLTRAILVDECSEGELGLRGAFIFAVLVALLHTLQAVFRSRVGTPPSFRFCAPAQGVQGIESSAHQTYTGSDSQPAVADTEQITHVDFHFPRLADDLRGTNGVLALECSLYLPQMMRLKKISLLRERITKPREYPFNIPTIASLNALEISSRVCFFVGENGTGKSTLLEAIAAHYGFGLEGGNRNFSPKTTDSVRTIEPLVRALRLSFAKRTGGGFYLRAESFFNVASYVDQVGASGSYGDKSLHDQSHGESFLSLLQNRFTRSGFYLMDEPEAALSPQRQLSFLILLHDLVKGNDNIQFIIATHSPILLAYPEAQIFSFDEGKIHQIDYRESQPFQLISRFIAAPERYINALFSELPFSED